MSEVTFKLIPCFENEATLLISGLSDVAGIEMLSRALGSPFEVSGAAHLPAGIGSSEARTILRIENFAPSVAYRAKALQDLLGAHQDGVVRAEFLRDLGGRLGVRCGVNGFTYGLLYARTLAAGDTLVADLGPYL